MYTYKLHVYTHSNHVIIALKEFEDDVSVKTIRETVTDKIIKSHPLSIFFKEAMEGIRKIEFEGITFNIVYEVMEDYIKFTSEADFETVSKTLLHFKNKYTLSLDILGYNNYYSTPKKRSEGLIDFDCFFKVEYNRHYDEPKGEFLKCIGFPVSDITVIKGKRTNNFFEMIMKFKNGFEEYKGIFLDIESNVSFEIGIGKKIFCTVYTDKNIEELTEFLLEDKEEEEYS